MPTDHSRPSYPASVRRIRAEEDATLILSIDEMAERMPEILKTFAGNPYALIAITDHNGNPALVVQSFEAWLYMNDQADALETLEFIADPEAMAALRRAEADIAAGNLIPGDVVVQTLVDEGLLDPELI